MSKQDRKSDVAASKQQGETQRAATEAQRDILVQTAGTDPALFSTLVAMLGNQTAQQSGQPSAYTPGAASPTVVNVPSSGDSGGEELESPGPLGLSPTVWAAIIGGVALVAAQYFSKRRR